MNGEPSRTAFRPDFANRLAATDNPCSRSLPHRERSGRARELYAHDTLAVALEQTVYALDSTTIDLCLSLFPWARLRRLRATLHTDGSCGVLRDASQTQSRLHLPFATSRGQDDGLRSDQTIVLAGVKSAESYPDALRSVTFYDTEQKRTMHFAI